jgi:uncharacterized membrane protein
MPFDKKRFLLVELLKKQHWLDRVCAGLMALAISAYIFVFARLTFRLMDQYSIMAYDIGIFDQATWLISRGEPPFITIRGLHLLADHSSIVMYLLSPLYWIAPTPKTLLLVQTFVLAIGSIPLYRFARIRTGSPIVALIIGSTYLLHPAVQWSNAFEFHPETFATTLLLQAFYLIQVRRWRPLFVCLILALLTKENVGLTVAFLGIYLWFARHSRIGIAVTVLGLIGMGASLMIVRYFNDGRPSPFFSLYNHLGSNPQNVLTIVFTRPSDVWAYIIQDMNRNYLSDIFMPLLIIVIMAPEILLLTIPSLLANLLSNRPVMHSIHHQYTTLIIPFVFIACVIGFERGIKWGKKWIIGSLMLIYLVCSAINGTRQGPLPSWQDGSAITPGLSAEEASRADQVIKLIPKNASLSVQPAFIPHLAHRRNIYAFPNPFYKVTWGYGERPLRQMEQRQFDPYSTEQLSSALTKSNVEYILLSPKTTVWPLLPEMYLDFLIPVFQNPNYGIITVSDNLVLLKRGADHQYGLKLLEHQSLHSTQTNTQVADAARTWISYIRLSI